MRVVPEIHAAATLSNVVLKHYAIIGEAWKTLDFKASGKRLNLAENRIN